MHKKTFETNANKRPAEPYDHLDDTFGNVCSSTECTGLITHAPLTEEELESFMDIYDFTPPTVYYDSKEKGNGPAYGSDITADSTK